MRLSYGWSDEVEGVLGGVGYAVGSLVPSWNKNNESMSEAFKRGYITHRDEERQKLEQARQNAPVLTAVGEIAGGAVSPFSKLVPMSGSPYINTTKKNTIEKCSKSRYYLRKRNRRTRKYCWRNIRKLCREYWQ